MLRRQQLGRIAVARGNLHFLFRQQLAVSGDRGDAVGLEQGGNPLSQVRDDLVLARHHGGKIDIYPLDLDPVAAQTVFRLLVELRGLQ